MRTRAPVMQLPQEKLPVNTRDKNGTGNHHQSCSVIALLARPFESVVRLLHFWNNFISCIDHTYGHTCTSEKAKYEHSSCLSVDSNGQTNGVDRDVCGAWPPSPVSTGG